MSKPTRRPDEASLIPEEFVDAFVATARDVAEISFFALMGLGAIGLTVGAIIVAWKLVELIRDD